MEYAKPGYRKKHCIFLLLLCFVATAIDVRSHEVILTPEDIKPDTIPTTTQTKWLMPKPKMLTENGTTFSLHRTVRLTDPTGSKLLASLFTTSDEATATVNVNLIDDKDLGTFDYVLAGFPSEGYKLSITADAISVSAASKTGVIRAAQTLMQLAAATNNTYIQGVEITDYPAFKLRGFMHDVGRSFISFEEFFFV